MPDRIPQLDHLATAAKETPMLSPAEIRRHGDRRRATRHTTSAIAAVLALSVGGVTVWNSPLFDNIRTPQWAEQVPGPTTPTTQSPLNPMTTPSQDPSEIPMPDPNNPGPPAPTWDNLPKPELFAFDHPDYVDRISNERESLEGAPIGACAPDSVGAPNRVLVREFGGGDTADATYRWVVVLGYPSVDEAITGFEAIRDGAKGCDEQLTADSMTPRIEDQTKLADFDRGEDTDFSSVLASGYREDESGLFSETVVLRSGPRVLWTSTTAQNGDLPVDWNCVPNEDPDMQQCEVPAVLPELLSLLDK
ncbi:MAG: hypothetical protein IPJ61_12325 [Tessaracoccus sp.]|uniref:hypothetical protein n=1 Tax=Tessaracoccus sp. TaxID=1971211 RepID=UPI001ECF6C39|nr:hypothetical protein [Tessaracoccus sp.]MBK7821829.1 hypothetical protein [Tessaracoccus sp.]